MSTSLTALPPELVSSIMANITSKPALGNLAQCSHWLYRCALPHLYRHITIHEEAKSGDEQLGLLRKLASLLLQRPDLAELVRHFELHVLKPSWMSEEPEHFVYSIADEQSRMAEESRNYKQYGSPKRVKAWSLSKEQKLSCLAQFSDTHTCHHDLILPMLLPVLLKVEKVELDFEIDAETYFYEKCVKRTIRRWRPSNTHQRVNTHWPVIYRPKLESLTFFIHSRNRFNVRRASWTGRASWTASLRELPAIQHISGAFANRWKRLFIDVIRLGSSSSPLTSLDLVDYRMNAEALGHILQASKALKAFSYTLCLLPAWISFTCIRHALGPHESCLQSLRLDCDKELGEDARHFRPMASFIRFNTLKIFKIAAVFLATTENGTENHRLINLFPSSLETLILTCFHPSFVSLLDALEHLLAQKSPQQIPSLKHLNLEENQSLHLRHISGHAKLMDVLWRGTPETAIGRLRSVAAAQGVLIDVMENYWWELEERMDRKRGS